MSIEERFLLFDNFTKKSGKNIASCALKNYLNLEFQNCIDQAYDNGANTAETYKGVFSPCGNHTLNFMSCDCAEPSKEAVTYFETTQETYNFCSSTPQGGKF